MADVSVTFAVGSEQATVVLPVDLPVGGEMILTGDIGGLVAAGTVARLRGDCRLIDNLHVRGTLLCDESGVDLDGQNLYDIHTHDGTLNLVGEEKTAWCRWGDDPVGWQVGDRLAVAPTKVGVYVPTETTWQGTWAATSRSANSPDVTLVDGSVARPEVANLSQSVVLRNLQRIMFHEASAPNPQTLKWIKVLNSGEAGVLGMYPIHFHLLGDHSRGSLLEGVVVEAGRNHAFVPHGSHGISFPGCVAYNTTGVAYWWDLPIPNQSPPHDANNSTDIDWDDTLAMWCKPSTMPGESIRLAGYWLGAGVDLKCSRAVATCVAGNPTGGPRERSGFHWPENGARTSWGFKDSVAHNNAESGLLVWQNAGGLINILEDFVAYRNGYQGINHGAYVSDYQYHGGVLTGNGLMQHAKSKTFLLFQDIVSDIPLIVTKHNSVLMEPSFYRNCSFPQVIYQEAGNGSYNVYEDCDLIPTDFNLTGISTGSIIEVKEGGVLTHRWQSGVWS